MKRLIKTKIALLYLMVLPNLALAEAAQLERIHATISGTSGSMDPIAAAFLAAIGLILLIARHWLKDGESQAISE